MQAPGASLGSSDVAANSALVVVVVRDNYCCCWRVDRAATCCPARDLSWIKLIDLRLVCCLQLAGLVVVHPDGPQQVRAEQIPLLVLSPYHFEWRCLLSGLPVGCWRARWGARATRIWAAASGHTTTTTRRTTSLTKTTTTTKTSWPETESRPGRRRRRSFRLGSAIGCSSWRSSGRRRPFDRWLWGAVCSATV